MMGAVSDGGKKRSSLVDTYNLFSARVERLAAELPPPIAKADVPDDLANATNAQLIERTAAILRSLLELEHPTTAEDAGLPVQTIAGPTGEAVESTPALAPKPTCAYGCGTRCVELKETRLDVWRLFHFLDPAEVKRRDDEATAVMFKQVGRGLPAWYFE
jgi:hypothetical protein